MKKWLISVSILGVSVVGLTSVPASGATLDQEVQGLTGEWQGAALDGASASLDLVAAEPGGLMTGHWQVDTGLVAGALDFTLVKLGNLQFAVPGTAPALAPEQGAFALQRLPGGGLKLTRLVRDAAASQLALQVEELTIGKTKKDGTRTAKLSFGERLCFEGPAAKASVCGQAKTEAFTMRHVTP